MIIREKYLNEIRQFYDSDIIKVITGIRRCGKSVILETIKDEISKKTDNIIYLNLEKTSDFDMVSTKESLIKYVQTKRKYGLCYVFLDEVQNIDDWQIAIKDLRLSKCSIFVTGSNSKLLSNEILTTLSGRFVSFRIRPFVFKEIVEFENQKGKIPSLNDYLIWGGFPGRFDYDNEDAAKKDLSEIEATIVVNDLIARYKIKKESVFKRIVHFVLKSNARIISAQSICKYFKSESIDISINTVIKFLDYLKQAYIIDEIPVYSTKAKRELSYYGKFYNADVCFNSLNAIDNKFDLEHNLENIIYNELIYMGYDVRVYNNENQEIDFRATKNRKTYYIQVSYSVANDITYKREFGAFEKLKTNDKKILISNDPVNFSTSTVQHIKLDEFLMMDELPN